MKKLLTCTLLAVAALTIQAAPSFASGCCFGLFYKHCGCCGCGANFCVRQYNAFSPVCCGTVFCDGCCPFGSCGYGGGYGGGACAGGMCPGGMNYMGTPACAGPGCDGGAMLGSLPAAETISETPGAPVSADANPVVSPSTLPTQMPAGPVSKVINDRGIQNTSYRPASTPAPRTIAPVRTFQPQAIAAPSYWGN